MNEIALTQGIFTQLCKAGFYTVNTSETGRFDLTFYSTDLLKLYNNEMVTKTLDNTTYNFMTVNINNDDFKEIVKRSPMFSNLIEKL